MDFAAQKRALQVHNNEIKGNLKGKYSGTLKRLAKRTAALYEKTALFVSFNNAAGGCEIGIFFFFTQPSRPNSSAISALSALSPLLRDSFLTRQQEEILSSLEYRAGRCFDDTPVSDSVYASSLAGGGRVTKRAGE